MNGTTSVVTFTGFLDHSGTPYMLQNFDYAHLNLTLLISYGGLCQTTGTDQAEKPGANEEFVAGH